MQCADITHSQHDTEEIRRQLQNRILEFESQAIKNENIMNKIIHEMESSLTQVERNQYEVLSKNSKDEAVKAGRYNHMTT